MFALAMAARWAVVAAMRCLASVSCRLAFSNTSYSIQSGTTYLAKAYQRIYAIMDDLPWDWRCP